MNRLFWNVLLRMSLCGSVISILLGCFLPLKMHFTPRWRRRFLLAALLFFILPVSIPLPQLFRASSPLVQMGIAIPPPAVFDPVLPPWPPVSPAFHMLDLLLSALPFIWLAGTLCFALRYIGSAIHFSCRLRRNCSAVTDGPIFEHCRAHCREMGIRKIPVLLQCSEIGTPMCFGIIKPKLILPAFLSDEQQLHHVLRHELTHLKSKDLWWKLAVLFLSVLHWFNPLMHLLRHHFDELCELTCDESLALNMDASERHQYAAAILHLMGKAAYCPLSTAFSKQKEYLKGRLTSIMNPKKMTIRMRLASAGFTAVLLLTGVILSSLLSACSFFHKNEAGSIGIIGGADGPTAIFIAENPSPDAMVYAVLSSVNISQTDGTISITIPDAKLSNGQKWFIHLSGRTKDGLSQHWLEENEANYDWQPGETYTAAFDADTMESGTVDAAVLDKNGKELSFGSLPWTPAGITESDAETSSEPFSSVSPTAALSDTASAASQNASPALFTVPSDIARPSDIPALIVPVSEKEARTTVKFGDYLGHTGIDLTAPVGTDIAASADGTVVLAEYSAYGYGYYLIVDHGNGCHTLYGNCSKLLLKAGDTVTQGQKIAEVGRTGNATVPHCHFELLLNETPINCNYILEGFSDK